jgi:hypothetical protein
MSQDVLETSQPVVHCVAMAICASPSSIPTIGRMLRAVTRLLLAFAVGRGERRNVRARVARDKTLGTTWDVLGQHPLCVQCDAVLRGVAGTFGRAVVARYQSDGHKRQRRREGGAGRVGAAGRSITGAGSVGVR